MPSSFWVASTKPEAALVRGQGWQPWQGRGRTLASRDRGPEAGMYCWEGHLDADGGYDPVRAKCTGRPLDVRFVPEREGEQAPELAAQVLAAGDVVFEHACDGVGPEVTLPLEPLAPDRLAGERLQLAAEPGRRRNREASLLPVDDPSG